MRLPGRGLQAGVIALASVLMTIVVGSAGATTRYLELAPPGADAVVFSADGSKLFFTTGEALVPADTDGRLDVYQQSGGAFTLLSTGPSGGNGAYDAYLGVVSADSSHVVFRTDEALVASDTDGGQDYYVWAAGQTELVTSDPPGDSFNNETVFPDRISQDGSRIYLVRHDGGGPFGNTAYYLHTGGQTSVVLSSAGPMASSCGVSADGTRFFVSTIMKLVPSDTDSGGNFNAWRDVYEIVNGLATLVSTSPTSPNGQFDAGCAGISVDGSRVFFETDEPLVAGDTDSSYDIYERSAGTTTLVSTGLNGGNGAYDASVAQGTGVVSDDGGHVFFRTGEQLVVADTDGQWDVYERSGGVTSLVSTGAVGGNGGNNVVFVGASADGSRAYFMADEVLDPADTDAQWDIYERSGGQTRVATVGPAGGNGDVYVQWGSVVPGSGDLFFATPESLVASDTDSEIDVYEWDGTSVSAVSQGNGTFPASFAGAARDGSRLSISTAEQLSPTDTDADYDIYIASLVADESGGGTVPEGGGTVSTGSTLGPADPIETSVTSPSGGTVTITEESASAGPAGFVLVGMQAQIDVSVAPPPTAAQPLTIVFDLDGSLLVPSGLDHTTVQVLKDGVLVPGCTTATPANPDPCVSQRAPLAGGGAEITVRTSGASTWQFGAQTDATGPVVTPSVVGTAGSNGWFNGDVTVSWSVTDLESTVTSTSGCGSTVLTTDTAGTTFTCVATSSGGTTTEQVTVKRDATPPTLSCRPATFTLGGSGGSVVADASDATSGPAAATVSKPANVSTAGVKSVSLSGSDQAGNSSAPTSCTYVVAYNFLGFTSPTAGRTYNSGSTAHVRFALGDATGARIPDGEAKTLAAGCGVKLTFTGGTPSPNCVDYDAKAGTFTFGLKTDKSLSGPHTVTVTVTTGGDVVNTESVAIQMG